MTLVARIIRHLQAMARMLAVVAAMVLALGVHSPHAASETTVGNQASGHHVSADHNHFGFTCVKATIDRPVPGISGEASLNHADCTQIFDPLQRSPAAGVPDYIISIVTAPRELSFRQVVNTFDPPPPRHG